jgi:hypothetical protein
MPSPPTETERRRCPKCGGELIHQALNYWRDMTTDMCTSADTVPVCYCLSKQGAQRKKEDALTGDAKIPEHTAAEIKPKHKFVLILSVGELAHGKNYTRDCPACNQAVETERRGLRTKINRIKEVLPRMTAAKQAEAMQEIRRLEQAYEYISASELEIVVLHHTCTYGDSPSVKCEACVQIFGRNKLLEWTSDDRKAHTQAYPEAIDHQIALKTATPRDTSNRVVMLLHLPYFSKTTLVFHDSQCTVTTEINDNVLKDQLHLSFAEGEEYIDGLKKVGWKEVQQ